MLLLFGALNAQEVFVPELSIVEDSLLQNCKIEKVEFVSTTRYENEAKSFLRFLNSESENFTVYLNNSEGVLISEIQVNNSELLIEGLTLNTEYFVKGIDNCDREYLVANISTSAPSGQFINVPPNLFDALVDRTEMDDPPKLCDYLQTLENVNYHEKAAYLQQFYFDNSLLPPDFEICIPPPPPVSCICKFVIRGFNAISSGSFPPGGTEIIPENNSEYPRRFNYSELAWGPSRYNYLEFGDRCVHSGNPVRFGVENGNASTYDAFIRVMLQCEGILELPEDCECDRSVNLDYEYEAHLFAEARSRASFWCGWGGHTASAHAEDWVIMTIETPDTVQTLSAARAGAESRCNSNANPEFFLSIVQIATGIATAATGNVTLGQIDTIAQNIVNLLDDSGFTQNGTCGSIDNQYAMRGNRDIELEPNKLTSFYMSSFFVVEGDGATKFHTDSKIGSNFRMSLAHRGGFKNADPLCCLDAYGWWLSGAAHGVDEHDLNLTPSSANTFSPGTQQNMILGTNSHFFPVLGTTVNTPCGEWTENYACPYDDEGRIQIEDDKILAVKKENLYSILNNVGEKTTNSQFWIHDVYGRLIHSGISKSELSQLLQTNMEGNPNIYFISFLNKNNRPETMKIIR